jgi:hypothetical protein
VRATDPDPRPHRIDELARADDREREQERVRRQQVPRGEGPNLELCDLQKRHERKSDHEPDAERQREHR